MKPFFLIQHLGNRARDSPLFGVASLALFLDVLCKDFQKH